MVKSIVNKIIFTGLKNYSKTYQVLQEKTHIRIYFDEVQTVKYDMCIEWQPKETVTFKQILNKKLDLLGYEALATPIFKKSLDLVSEELKIEKNDISIFIFSQSNILGLCVFNKAEHVKTLNLSEHLSELGF